MNVKKSTLKAIIKIITEGVLREMNAMQDDPKWGDEFSNDQSFLSRCCQMPALGELDKTDPENPVGICSGCQDHATFEPAVEEQGAGGGGAGAGASGGTGASVTGNVSSYSTPGAFKRKNTTEDYPAARAGTAGFDSQNPNQRKPWRHIDSGFFEISGKLAIKLTGGKIPKHGYEKIVHAPKGFPSESGWVWLARTTTGGRQVWSIRQALRNDPYVTNKGEKTEAVLYPTAGMEEEGKIDETSTSGAAGAYNVPGCFSKKGGSRKGIAGSEALGYTLTATGRKDMERSADKLLEGKNIPRCAVCKKPLPKLSANSTPEHDKDGRQVCSRTCAWSTYPGKKVNETSMGQLGTNFSKGQRAYDAQMPPEEHEGPECPECGSEIRVTDSGKKQGYWWVKGQCPSCGYKYSEDNF